jgi:AraC-like DNA-binding protein
LSRQHVRRLFEAAVALTGDDMLGLSVGQVMSTASLHLVGHLILASVSLRQAIELVDSAGPNMQVPAIEDLSEGRARVGFYSHAMRTAGARVESQITAVILHDIALHFLNGTSEALAVQFAFPAPADTSAYRRAFRGGIQFDAGGTFVSFPREVLDQHRNGANPALTQQLFRLAQDCYRMSGANDTWTGRVRRALRAHAVPRLLDPGVLSNQLGVSKRGLWRRLAREGTSFSTLIDEALFERAQTLLAHPATTCARIAEALGYAELSSFHRAFRRWSGGLTPTEYRQHLCSEDRVPGS